jgi:hypothetical protein
VAAQLALEGMPDVPAPKPRQAAQEAQQPPECQVRRGPHHFIHCTPYGPVPLVPAHLVRTFCAYCGAYQQEGV